MFGKEPVEKKQLHNEWQ